MRMVSSGLGSQEACHYISTPTYHQTAKVDNILWLEVFTNIRTGTTLDWLRNDSVGEQLPKAA